MAFHETLSLVLGAITFLALILYLLYGGLHKTFQRVGFTPQEATLILAGTFIGAFFNIPLFTVNGWIVAINAGGALVPVAVTWILLRRRPSLVLELLAATTVVALVTYLVTYPTEQGIVSPFPLYLLPPLAAASMSLGAFWREEDFAAPLAYMAGTLGTLIGADVFRLPEFLAQSPPTDGVAMASIGGAAVFDMVYLTGIIAVGLDALFFNQVHRRKGVGDLPYREHTVFTVSTPSEVIRDYSLETDRAGTVAGRASAPAQRAPATAGVRRPGESRLEIHRAWEERMRNRQ